MPSFYFYKLTADNNGAPCVDEDAKLLSLAICKPMIRSTAQPGDWIFGFAANSLYRDNRLLYVACVTCKEKNGAYYTAPKYAQRGDCVYEKQGDHFVWREGALHHGPSHLAHDLGNYPHYDKAHVLLGTDFRYFGKNGSAEYKSRFPLIKQAVETLGVGHRVKHNKALREQLQELKNWLWADTRQADVGEPTSTRCHGVCHRTRFCGVV